MFGSATQVRMIIFLRDSNLTGLK